MTFLNVLILTSSQAADPAERLLRDLSHPQTMPQVYSDFKKDLNYIAYDSLLDSIHIREALQSLEGN
jgi:hypothetical protein